MIALRRPSLPFLLLAACAGSAVVPRPLAGPSPERVLVWPHVAAGAYGDALAADLDRALRARGHVVMAPAVARQLLVDSSLWPDDGELPADAAARDRLGRELAVDAVLVLRVRQFEVEQDRRFRSARWDLAWELLSTRGKGELWRYEHHGAWYRHDATFDDPHRPLDAEPAIVPIGGDRTPNFRDVPELALALHRMAMAELPRGPR